MRGSKAWVILGKGPRRKGTTEAGLFEMRQIQGVHVLVLLRLPRGCDEDFDPAAPRTIREMRSGRRIAVCSTHSRWFTEPRY